MESREDAKRNISRHLRELLEEEISEAGARFARAWVAEQKGLAEVASVLKDVAYDEAKHAAWIGGLIPEEGLQDLRSGVLGAIDADSRAAQREKEFAETAREVGMEQVARLFEQLSEDEISHVKKLREALEKLS